MGALLFQVAKASDMPLLTTTTGMWYHATLVPPHWSRLLKSLLGSGGDLLASLVLKPYFLQFTLEFSLNPALASGD